MSFLFQATGSAENNIRRSFLRGTSVAALSTGAVLLLAGRGADAAGSKADVASDIGILNVALGLEHEGINAYTLGAKSGLLQKPVLDIALKFQDDHKAHRDLLWSPRFTNWVVKQSKKRRSTRMPRRSMRANSRPRKMC